MDLMKIGLYGLAGFGAYAAYEHFSKKGAAASATTVPPITTEDATSSFTGTNWQQAGRNRETMWQNGGVFSNATGGGRYLPTGIDRRATPNASNQWLAAIPRTARPSESNQWLAAMPGRVGGPLGPRPADPPLSRRAGGGGKPLSPVDVRFRYASGELQEKQVMKMSVAKLVMGYLGIGLTAFVIGYAIRKGGTAAK